MKYVCTPYPDELRLSVGLGSSPKCRPNARQSTHADIVKTRTSRCRARTHRGPAQTQHTHSQAQGVGQNQPAFERANRRNVRAYRWLLRLRQDLASRSLLAATHSLCSGAEHPIASTRSPCLLFRFVSFFSTNLHKQFLIRQERLEFFFFLI